ncbi:MAG: glycosyltransferase family 2 protein [Agriterribacter sp.]
MIINKTKRVPILLSDCKFSILIPSWNNLPYLKKCIESIRKNSTFKHEIIVHINEGTDGSFEWIDTQPDISYTYSETNTGVCFALNACRALAGTDYILYMNDDMYVCPGWDKHLYEEIENTPHKYFFFSATAIEPRAQSVCSIEKSYGNSLEDFNEETLLKEFAILPMSDWHGATWSPNIVHKDIWDIVGGYSIEFSPGLYSDPDFSMKLWSAGVRLFKGVAKSRVYHFTSVSVNRVKQNEGYHTFIAKWGVTAGSMSKYMLRRGTPFTGTLAAYRFPLIIRMKNFFKSIFSITKLAVKR